MTFVNLLLWWCIWILSAKKNTYIFLIFVFMCQASCGEVHMRDEVDIVVDFTTPEQPGWYSSYWRLALCTGHKFGQVVCVDIQVIIIQSFLFPHCTSSSILFIFLFHSILFPNLSLIMVQVSTFTDDSKWNLGLKAAADKDKCFKKFKQKGNETKRDGFNLNNRRVASASDLGMDEKVSSALFGCIFRKQF